MRAFGGNGWVGGWVNGWKSEGDALTLAPPLTRPAPTQPPPPMNETHEQHQQLVDFRAALIALCDKVKGRGVYMCRWVGVGGWLGLCLWVCRCV